MNPNYSPRERMNRGACSNRGVNPDGDARPGKRTGRGFAFVKMAIEQGAAGAMEEPIAFLINGRSRAESLTFLRGLPVVR